MSIQRVGGETMVLYADLRERLEVFENIRSIAALPGEFTTKRVKGCLYHYYQAALPSGRIQFYLGRDGREIRRLIAERTEGKKPANADQMLFQRLAAQIIAGGVPAVPAEIARVLCGMANSAVFKVGGVLIGSVAMQIIATHLGVHLHESIATTQDVDIAGGVRVSVAVPDLRADIPSAIESLQMGFFPVPRLSNKEPSTSYAIRGKTLRIDLVTPMKGEKNTPVLIPRFNAAAQPLKYLDYLIEDPVSAAMISGTPCLVNVPQPARFALHKLIVSQIRDIASAAKRKKDVLQAKALIEILREDMPAEIEKAKAEILKRSGSWAKNLQNACREHAVRL